MTTTMTKRLHNGLKICTKARLIFFCCSLSCMWVGLFWSRACPAKTLYVR